jgi:hypothetical protein
MSSDSRNAPAAMTGPRHIGGRCESHRGGSWVGGSLILTNNVVNPTFGIALSNNIVTAHLTAPAYLKWPWTVVRPSRESATETRAYLEAALPN